MKLFYILPALLLGAGAQANPNTKSNFLSLFTTTKPLIAAVMVETDFKDKKSRKEITDLALDQLRIAEENGMQGLLVEFRGGEILAPKITKEKYNFMLEVLKKIVKKADKTVIGVEILWHYPNETLKLARDSGAKFVRTDFFSDQVVADSKPVPIDPEAHIAYKKKIGARNVFLLTDVQVKYSEMIDKKITLAESAATAIKKGSQGIIVTSEKSGTPPSVERVSTAKSGIKDDTPLIIGSGFSKEVAKDLLPLVDAVIVGTSISVKTGGPLVPEKVKELVAEAEKIRNELKKN